jgi:DNA adenine methylase
MKLDTYEPKPFLKWAGGKSSVLSSLHSYLPKKFSNFHEPMIGGGAFFINLKQNKSCKRNFFISDYNEDLVNTYDVVNRHVKELIQQLKKIEKTYLSHNTIDREKYYYEMRAYAPINSVEKASRFIFLNKTCFNGLYRVNKSGQFNVPHGKYKSPKICDINNLLAISDLLNGVIIKQHDIKNGYSDARAKDLIYLDPPFYPISKTADFTSYTSNKFLHNEQLNLKLLIDNLTKKKIYVMLSNSDHPWIVGAYQASNYNVEFIQARRSLSSSVKSRGQINELVITNYHLIDENL